MNDNDTDIQSFKDFLEAAAPEDFNRSSAIQTIDEGYEGAEGFEEFVNQNLETAEHAFVEADGQINPMVYLANASQERVFEAYHDETMRDLFQRLHREAREMGATMVFVAMMLHAANRELDIDATDGDEVRAAIARGDLRLHFAWYAERRHGMTPTSPGAADRRGGLWEIEDSGLGERTDGRPEVAPLFHSILP